MNTGFVIWFTGLSGSGKSTLTRMVTAEIRRRGVHVEALDGDDVRKMLSKGLGFSKDDRNANIRRIGFVARMLARSGACGIAAAISPYKDIRDEIRRATDRFCEVYCECPIDVLAERDPKGLYKRALAGEIKNFTGVDDPYEAPENPEVHCRTDLESAEESAAKIIRRLEELGYLPTAEATAAEVDAGVGGLPLPHGAELVDRVLTGALADDARARAAKLPVLKLDARAQRDLIAIAMGAFSPLTGFMTRKDYRKVVAEKRLENGLAWPLPVMLPVVGTGEETGAVALEDAEGRRIAILDVADVWEIDRDWELEHVYANAPADCSGRRRLAGDCTHYVGGEVHVWDLPGGPDALATPADTRRQLVEHGWRNAAALPLAAPMVRADEYRARCALEIADGLLIMTADAPAGGIGADASQRWHEHVVREYFRPERVLGLRVPTTASGARDRDALMATIVAKNYGSSSSIVPYDAEAGAAGVRPIFDYYLPGELGITPLCFDDVFHSTKLGLLASTKTAPDAVPERIARTKAELLAALQRGESAPDELIRPEMRSVLGLD